MTDRKGMPKSIKASMTPYRLAQKANEWLGIDIEPQQLYNGVRHGSIAASIDSIDGKIKIDPTECLRVLKALKDGRLSKASDEELAEW